MAVDNLNYYSSGLPAGQQTDKYTSQPGCLKSKNLDIFSSSKSVKATAWSEPSAGAGDIIKQDGDLILKTDGKVYDISSGSEVLVVDPSINFPKYYVSYNGQNGTYSQAQWGTVKDMTVKYEGDEWKSFVVFTNRSSYTYSKIKYVASKSFANVSSNLTLDQDGVYTNGYLFRKNNTTSSTSTIGIYMDNVPYTTVPIKIKAVEYDSDDTNISLSSVTMYEYKYYYDPELDSMVTYSPYRTTKSLSFSGTITDGIEIVVPAQPGYSSTQRQIALNFTYTKKSGASTYGWGYGELYVDFNGGPTESHRKSGNSSDGDYNEYYSYLPIDSDRHLEDIGEYYRMPGTSFQTLYTWQGSWTKANQGNKSLRYDFVQYMGWANDVSMDVVAMIAWNEQIYMIGNMNGNGYIFPCDLSGGRGTPYIAYGCTFKGATNIDYLLYLVGEDRGVSTLWVFNQQELVPLVGGSQESQYDDLVGVDEQYRFDGKIVNYRKNLILTTSDGRIFRYGQTYGGKGGTFIHDLPEDCEIKSLKAKDNDLIVNYAQTTTSGGVDTVTNYAITYQDDTPYKNYNTEWEAVYPIVLGNHLLEKEESDLYASYILPSFNTSLEFWGMANHYHFWTFTSADDPTLNSETHYKLEDAYGSYYLQFVERNGDQWTFRLIGDLPSLTEINELGSGLGGGGLGSFIPGVGGEGKYKILNNNGDICLTYDSFNHFRKIGEITTDSYQEGEFRFHNLNNKLELPKTHSLQIMVKGKGNENYTPELFALDLVANQRDRG